MRAAKIDCMKMCAKSSENTSPTIQESEIDLSSQFDYPFDNCETEMGIEADKTPDDFSQCYNDQLGRYRNRLAQRISAETDQVERNRLSNLLLGSDAHELVTASTFEDVDPGN